MENKAHALAAGLFVLIVSALVAGLGMWLTRDAGNYHAYELSSRAGVSGLQPQAAVRYKGVAVGKVTHIGFDPQINGNVLIRIAVHENTPLTPSTFAVLGYQGVTGLAYVLLDDAGEPQARLPAGPSGLPRLPLRNSPFSQLADQGQAILGRVDEAVQRINQLLSDDNQQRIGTALTEIGQAAGSVGALGRRLDATVSQRLDPALAALPPLAQETSRTLQSLQSTSTEVAGVARAWGRTAGQLNAQGGALEQVTVGAQALSHAIDRFNHSTLAHIEGVSDDASYAARQLGRVAANLNDNPQALLYGSGRAVPGPGEPGFAEPAVPLAQP
ncbi:MlaD family protein [Giesbergeria anulus]|uniref:Phospholipid/cholesterol/gamma-HCH transport system substrate-binding protein n=1 Tax=Giesbergeria anulus TaxID=180197 RepID=A0A1H9M6X7_9BURK|nr:MlaD family protein [Giesbergeria anulus]SER19382.1 phospholipid/cholesterol/gamma-HCH transport system substrate-binding protein [Giesbergeria anulus]